MIKYAKIKRIYQERIEYNLLNKKNLLLGLAILLLTLSLSGCVPNDGTNSPNNLAGFFSGVWHGWIAPFSLLYSLSDSSVSIYEIYNTGLTYNLGYYMAVISGFGSLALFRRKKDKD